MNPFWKRLWTTLFGIALVLGARYVLVWGTVTVFHAKIVAEIERDHQAKIPRNAHAQTTRLSTTAPHRWTKQSDSTSHR